MDASEDESDSDDESMFQVDPVSLRISLMSKYCPLYISYCQAATLGHIIPLLLISINMPCEIFSPQTITGHSDHGIEYMDEDAMAKVVHRRSF